MKDVYLRAVFALSGAEYTWGDVALAAALRGDWRAVDERARLGSRLLAREDAADGDALPDDVVESAANAFRYARDLVTAEETEAWLDRWDLDPEAWMTWIASDLLCKRGGDGSSTLEPLPEASESSVHAEAACSGALERFAIRLAEAAAVAARLDEEGGPGSPENGVPEIQGPVPADFDPAGLPFDPPPEGFGPRLLELARLERARRRWREAPVSPDDVEAIVRIHQTDWLRVRALVLSLRSEDAAREALLSIRDDGRAVEEVARDAAATRRSEDFTLASVDESLRDHLLAGRKGEWAGPFPCGDARTLVMNGFSPASYDFGSVIVRGGERADAFFVLVSGKARVVKTGVVVRRVDRLEDALSWISPSVATAGVFPLRALREMRDLPAATGVSAVFPLGESERAWPGMPHDGMKILSELVSWASSGEQAVREI